MYKLLYLLVGILVISVVIVFGALALKAFNPQLIASITGGIPGNQPTTQDQTNQTTSQPSPDISSNIITGGPIPLDNPYLYTVGIRYSFVGQLASISQTVAGEELMTDIKGAGLPKFILNKDTEYYTWNDNNLTRVTREYLKAGQIIRVHLEYVPNTKQFNLIRITVLI